MVENFNLFQILAQVNFGSNTSTFLGMFIATAALALYFLRVVRPELSRDTDIFLSVIGLLYGFILIFQGWRLDPSLQFAQLLLVIFIVCYTVENIRLRQNRRP